jgi:hypothetical protein
MSDMVFDVRVDEDSNYCAQAEAEGGALFTDGKDLNELHAMILDLLRELCALGAQLTRLHLMEPSAVDTARFPLPRYPMGPEGGGGNRVEKVRYSTGVVAQAPVLAQNDMPGSASTGACATGRVWINDFQYFEGVAPEVWEFRVGGYQPCEKWLKDRKGRTLTYDDIEHCRLIAGILAQTRALMGGIDEAIMAHGGWPLR